MKKLLKAFLILVAAGLLLSIGSHVVVNHRVATAEKQVAATLEKDIFQPEELRADIAFYRDLYRRVHPTPIAEFPIRDVDGELARLGDSLHSPMTRLEFYRLLAPIISSTGDEHTSIDLPEIELAKLDRDGGTLFPYTVGILDHRLYVVDPEATAAGISSGTEITAVNGVPAAELMATLEGLFAGTGDIQKEFFAAQRFAEALYLAYGRAESFRLDVVDARSGEAASFTVDGSPRADGRSEDRAAATRESPDGSDQDSSFEILPAGHVLFHFNSFSDPGGRLTGLLDEIFTYLGSAPGRHLVIDVRPNPGGDTRIADEVIGRFHDQPYFTLLTSDLRISPEMKSYFMSHLPAAIRWLPIQYFHPWTRGLFLGNEGDEARIEFDEIVPPPSQAVFDGQVVVLMGPGAYSSSAIFLATLDKYHMATLVGTPSGGYPTHYGNATPHHLPNTGLLVFMPASTNYGHGTGPVRPHHQVEQTTDDFRLGRDTQLEFALSLLEGDAP